MSKQIKIRIFPDGTVKSETVNMKGKSCLNYIRQIEDLLEAKVVDSEFTKEFYEEESESCVMDNFEIRMENRNG